MVLIIEVISIKKLGITGVSNLQVWCSGSTLVSQADRAGSSPVTCSI